MRDPLVIAVAQPQCVPHDVATNAATHAATVRSARARVVVFPELSLTGYELDAAAIATDDARLSPIVEACAEAGALALVGAPLQGGPHIATLAIDGAGAAVAYRKICLGGAEPERFVPGDAPAVLDVDGWRLGLATCKDIGVARHAADTAARGIDLYLASTAKTPDEAPVQEQNARRIATDHGVWVAVASFAGPTGVGYERTAGRSGVWAPGGAVIAQAGPEPGALASARIST